MLAIEHKCRSNIRMGILTVQLAIEVLLMRGLWKPDSSKYIGLVNNLLSGKTEWWTKHIFFWESRESLWDFWAAKVLNL